jgi:hypothetical protein
VFQSSSRSRSRRGLRAAGDVSNFPPMRLLRILAHLVLALGLVGVSVAPARAGALALAASPAHHSGMDHHSSGVHAEHAGYDHGSPASEHPAHKRDACQTACCFVPSQLPPHGSDATAIEFFCAVRYVEAGQPGSGRADAPDPGIPKAVF